jgi:hypothetical protein
MGLKHLAGDRKLKVSTSGLAPNRSYRISATNLTTGGSSYSNTKTRGGKFVRTVYLDTRGVVKVTISSTKGVEKTYLTVGSQDIDCCIAKLVHDAINCTCKCNKCKEDLNRAQTIRLLLQAAAYEASIGLEESVVEKYNKAKELCTEVCACGC